MPCYFLLARGVTPFVLPAKKRAGSMSLLCVADKRPRFSTVPVCCEQIRLVEGRDRPIDRLAKNVLLFGEQDEGEDDVRYVAESCVFMASTCIWYSNAVQSCKPIVGMSFAVLSWAVTPLCFLPRSYLTSQLCHTPLERVSVLLRIYVCALVSCERILLASTCCMQLSCKL